jgi:hypothetical protein
MARKRIALSQFAVSSERDDYGVSLTHGYRRCDWETWVDGMSPGDLRRVAREHARVCDGKPQPRPERTPGTMGGLVPSIWSHALHDALAVSLAAQRPFVTGVPEL